MKSKKDTSLLIAILLIFHATTIFSQNACTIQGKVVEKKMPVEFASILLFDISDTSRPIRNTITDSLGHFIIKKILKGKYVLKIQLIGYVPERRVIELNQENEIWESGIISLAVISQQLESVTITASKSIIQKTAQGFIVNAGANLTQMGGTVTDLLRYTPTVVVDAEGAITLRGKSPLILINGRNSSIANTDQIPASSVESIEIINNPSAQYDADAESGIINIILKKSKKPGNNGAVALGTGIGAKGRINSSVLLNHKTEKINVGLAYDNRFAGRTRRITGDRINFNMPDEHFLTQRRSDERVERLQNLRLNVDLLLNPKNELSFEVNGSLEEQDNDETLNNTLEKQNKDFNSKSIRHSLELERSKVAEFAANYNRKYDDNRKSLSAGVSSSLNFDRENTDITSQSQAENNTPLRDPFLQRTHNNENTSITNIKMDFVQPVSGKAVIETGYKGIIRFLDADFQSLDNQNGSYEIDPLASNVFNFREQVHAAYIQFRSFAGDKDKPTWKYDMGVRGEQVWNNGHGAINNVSFRNNYFNFFPTANISYYKTRDEFWKASYSRRINRPGLGQLNPFVDITDSLNKHGGNPYLKPELVHSFEWGYNKEWSKLSLYATLFYRYATNTIRQFTVLLPNGVALTQPVNIGNVATYGLENIITARPFKKYDVNLSLSFFQQHIDGTNVDKAAVNEVFSWYGKLINNFVLWPGGKLQVTGIYNSPLATPQGKRIAIYNADLGFQQKLGKGNERLGLIVTDVFNTLKNGFEMNASDFTYHRTSKSDTRALLITFAYTFGTSFKEKLMENTFSNDQ